MILRLILLCGCGAGAYSLLKGYPVGMPVLLRGCLAVLLLVAGLAWWAALNKVGNLPVVKGERKPRIGDIFAMGAGVLAVECAFLWLLSASPQPLENAALVLEQRFKPAAADSRQKGEGSGEVSGNWLWDKAQRRALPRRTNLKPGAKPEVFIRLPDAGDAEKLLKKQVYVRAFALDDFRDGIWTMRENDPQHLEGNDEGWIELREGSEEETGILHEVFHGRGNAGRDVLTALQGVRAVRLPNLHKVGGTA